MTRNRQAGFTLLELLVVMVIIAVVASLATLSVSFRNPGEQARREAERLAALLELAGEESIINGENLGVGFTAGGYSFYRLEGEGWAVLADDPLLRPRNLPEGLALVLEDQPADAGLVQVMLLASGEQTPFSLELEQGGGPLYRLRGDELGGLELEALP